MINKRIMMLQKKLQEANIDAAIYATSASLQYLLDDVSYFWQRTPETGFYAFDWPLYSTPSSYFLNKPDVFVYVPADGEATVIATHERAKGMKNVNVKCHYVMMADYLRPLVKAKKVAVGLGCEQALKNMLGEIDNTIETTAGEFLVEELRMIKDQKEIMALRKTAEFTDYAMGEIVKLLRPGIRRWEVEERLNFIGTEYGCSDIPFEPTCSYSKIRDQQSIDYSGKPKDEPLSEGTTIAFDFGYVIDGYCSDFGRSFYCGKPGKRIADAYKALQDAQVRLLEKIKPGVSMAITFQTLYDDLKHTNFHTELRNFNEVELMGHQIGIDVHESPWLHKFSHDVFQPGMVMCIEPKILIPGEAFMRVEDMVLITENGCESLTKFDRELFELQYNM